MRREIDYGAMSISLLTTLKRFCSNSGDVSQRSSIFASELSLVGLDITLDITGMTLVKLRLFLAYARSCINAIGQSQVSAPN